MARLLAGVSAGLLWTLLAGYVARMAPEQQKGRAIAIAMVGTPLALSLGVPAGTFLGNLMGRRMCYGIMRLLALLLMICVRVKVPDFAGRTVGKRVALRHVFAMPGVREVPFVLLAFVLTHNTLFTYIAPLLATSGMTRQTDFVLLVFGITSLLGICIIGVLIDRHVRKLTLASTILFGLSAVALGVAGDTSAVVYGAVAIWGLAFGGAATLFQTALAKAAGEAADVAQSMLVTAWSMAIAGGALLDQSGVLTFSPTVLTLLLATLRVVWSAKYAASRYRCDEPNGTAPFSRISCELDVCRCGSFAPESPKNLRCRRINYFEVE